MDFYYWVAISIYLFLYFGSLLYLFRIILYIDYYTRRRNEIKHLETVAEDIHDIQRLEDLKCSITLKERMKRVFLYLNRWSYEQFWK